MLTASHINNLVLKAIDAKIILDDDYYYYFNTLATKVGFEYDGNEVELIDSDAIESASFLAGLIDPKKTTMYENYLLDSFMPAPSVLNHQVNRADFLDYFYKLGAFTNYIKESEIKKNVTFKYEGLDITINVSKPEKDPREIERLKSVVVSDYPKCPLCLSNVGFLGNQKVDPRSSHRTAKITLNNEQWHLQFSPYQYYNKHLIVLSQQHVDMKMSDVTVKYLLDFNDLYPDFFIGCNADIPIVGGSILNHNHFQAGEYEFAMERATIIDSFKIDDVKVDYLDWYLQTIKLSCKDKNQLIKIVNRYQANFKSYQNPSLKIENLAGNNAVNIITRIKENEYVAYLIFRNNETDMQHPYGLFHPTENLHHIKKENIGLIEAMGMAILPKRLLDAGYDDFEAYVGSHFVDVLRCCDIFRFGVDLDKVAIIKSWGQDAS